MDAKQLESFQFNPAEPLYIARCPFCGLDLMLGVRKDNGHASIAHSSHPDPNDKTHTRYMTGCERFNALVGVPDVLPRLHREGARWQAVEGAMFQRVANGP
jgi:hypothetical protein